MKDSLYKQGCIRTFSGKYVNIMNPKEEDLVIEDIAHSLSHQCRFGGHLPKFYSVAQHAIYCSFKVPFTLSLSALMHDASEAYLMDIPTPIKKLLPDYYEIEHHIMLLLAKKFGFIYPMTDILIQADKDMLEWEYENIMLSKVKNGVVCYTSDHAKKLFLKTFEALTINHPYNAGRDLQSQPTLPALVLFPQDFIFPNPL